jgi:hypothetical protein
VSVISSLADYGDGDGDDNGDNDGDGDGDGTSWAAGGGGGWRLEDRAAAEEEAAEGEEHGALTVPRGGLQAAVFEKDVMTGWYGTRASREEAADFRRIYMEVHARCSWRWGRWRSNLESS